MSFVAVAAAVIGTGVAIYGQVKAASAQADAQRKEADIKGLQSEELMSRQLLNEGIMRDKFEEADLATGSDNGVEDNGLGQRMRLRKQLSQNIAMSRREAEWKAKMLRMGADADMQLSSDIIAAGGISALGSGIQGAGRAYNAWPDSRPPRDTTLDLPKVSSSKNKGPG